MSRSCMRNITLVAVGDEASKKTELLLKYTSDRRLGANLEPSLFVNNIQDIIVDCIPYLVYFVNSEADDDYKSLRMSAYNEANCFLLCYSIANKRSFENLSKKWCIEIRKSSPNIPIILVGTEAEKRTSESEDCVTTEDGENLKHLIAAAAFVECSIDEFVKVDDVFIEAVRSVYGNRFH